MFTGTNLPDHFRPDVAAGKRDAVERHRAGFAALGEDQRFVGGFEPIRMVYARTTGFRGGGEFGAAVSYVAEYQAMLKLADTDIDKDQTTGRRTRISATYQIGGVPAFVQFQNKPGG